MDVLTILYIALLFAVIIITTTLVIVATRVMSILKQVERILIQVEEAGNMLDVARLAAQNGVFGIGQWILSKFLQRG